MILYLGLCHLRLQEIIENDNDLKILLQVHLLADYLSKNRKAINDIKQQLGIRIFFLAKNFRTINEGYPLLKASLLSEES